MIVAETAEGYQFVTQPDHAALAGQFADAWGNDDFDRPEPFDSLVLAAYAHDTGWRTYDRRPHLADGDPVDFREMPAEPWIALYDEGIDAVAEMDAYAGLLVSMHGAGLRNQRYGLSPSWPETPPEYREFVDREHRRQRRLLEGLLDSEGGGAREDGTASGAPDSSATGADRDLLRSLHADGGVPDGYDGRLWADYRRLQAWDALSLAFCLTDDPPGYDEIGAVPTSDPRGDTTLSVARVGAEAYTIDPYPFEASPLAVSVPVRTVAKPIGDESSLARAYYGSGPETRRFTLRRAEA
ncbi:DUF3891 family protein [Halosimplex litoreum]|uniref:DUF3891 family protein n=1 Tax=Halosimplex litoreum TaxID=1198301 RepID=A0A7T3KW70_9EURY|nr:DUF3891 family protein [Halosimplex litoreum]QPV63733.1 DUF3891 family protein [Halosimplex litoreum]